MEPFRWISSIALNENDLRLFGGRKFLCLVLGILISVLWIQLSQFSLAGYTYPVTPEAKGADLNTFLDAAWTIRHGGNPYSEMMSLPKTPISLLFFVPLTYFPDFNSIFPIYQLMTVLVVAGSIWLVASWTGFGFWTALAVLLLTIFSYPFQLHFERGQMDAFSVAVALLACFFAERKKWLPTYALGLLAVQLKPNALALVLPLFLAADLKTTLKRIGVFGLALALSFLATPGLSAGFFADISNRAQWMIEGNNGSIHRFFYLFPLGDFLAPLFLISVGSVLVFALYRRQQSSVGTSKLTGFFWMLPVFVAYPPTNFLYCYVFMPLLIFFWGSNTLQAVNQSAWAARVAWLGLLLALFPVGFFSVRYQSLTYWNLPSFGLFLILLVTAIAAAKEVRHTLPA